jgi:hypothetical protein
MFICDGPARIFLNAEYFRTVTMRYIDSQTGRLRDQVAAICDRSPAAAT